MRIDEALSDAVEQLGQTSDSPRLDAEILLARAIDVARSYLLAHPEDVLDELAALRYFDTVERRRLGLPIAYITGEKEFWSLKLMVGPETLVPRPETELLVELALRHLPRKSASRVLDLGTGSGAIALALASERPNCRIIATDVSTAALDIARENARQLELPNVTFIGGDWAEPLAGRQFEMIVSNPPYVRMGDPALEALKYEPALALTSGEDGLHAIRIIARTCRDLLVPDGRLLLEHGAEQQQEVAGILEVHGWSDVEGFKDLGGIPRVTVGKRGR